MKKILLLSLILVINLTIQTFCFAEEKRSLKIVYHTNPPSNLSPESQFLYNLRIEEVKKLKGRINIPGQPIIENFEMVYVKYSGKIPRGWMAQTLTWRSENDCNTLHVHVATRAGNDCIDILANEFYGIGFMAAMFNVGINICSIEDEGKRFKFWYDDKEWNDDQLAEAVSEVGIIRAAKKLKNNKIITDRFSNVLETTLPGYILIRYLVVKTNGDPIKYEMEIEKAVKEFIRQNKK
jgi:hypothetical protein